MADQSTAGCVNTKSAYLESSEWCAGCRVESAAGGSIVAAETGSANERCCSAAVIQPNGFKERLSIFLSMLGSK